MLIERITVGRVRSIPGEYGNRKMELTAVINNAPDSKDDPQDVALVLAATIDRQLIEAENQEKLIEQEERQRYDDEREQRIKQRKLDASRLYLTPTVRLHKRTEAEWMVLQELDWPIEQSFVLSRAGTWEEWRSIPESRIPEVVFTSEEEARKTFSEYPATEPTKEQMALPDVFADQ